MFSKFILYKHDHLILIGVCWAPVYPLISGVCQSVFCVFFADIDECINNTICDSHGFCDNTAGSFRCLCYQGFQAPQDGQGCVGEFLDFFSPPTCILSPHRKEIKVINSRRDCKQGNLVRISARFGFVTQFAVCKNSLWLPKWLGTLRNIKVWLWIRTYIRKNICLNSLVPLAQEIESGVWYSSSVFRAHLLGQRL